jgi:hypothetical protein
MGMVLPMCRFGTMRILTCITSGVNGKRIRTSSAMVARGSIQECCHRISVGASSCPFAMWLIWTTVPALQSDFRAADVLYANAALQGIDLQGHPHSWLSPGIDIDTRDERAEPARLRPPTPETAINQGSTYACRTMPTAGPTRKWHGVSLSRRGEAEH